eukprot:5553956-Amphidinium_carterae.1
MGKTLSDGRPANKRTKTVPTLQTSQRMPPATGTPPAYVKSCVPFTKCVVVSPLQRPEKNARWHGLLLIVSVFQANNITK